MNQLLFFYLPTCPHCQLAIRLLKALKDGNPAYAQIPVTMIDESSEQALANSYDYWYVPCLFFNGEKLHEGHAEEEDVKRVLDKVLTASDTSA